MTAPLSRTEALLGAVRVAVRPHRSWLDTTPLRSVTLVVLLNEQGYPYRVLVRSEGQTDMTRLEIEAAR